MGGDIESVVPCGATRSMVTTPKAYPKEFHGDVAAVAQLRGSGVTIQQIAEDFGISEG